MEFYTQKYLFPLTLLRHSDVHTYNTDEKKPVYKILF